METNSGDGASPAAIRLAGAPQIDALRAAVAESGRRSTVQLPGSFAFDERGRPTPLGALVRLGEPAMKTYFTLALLTRKPPHKLFRGTSAGHLAHMLGFAADATESTSSGARRVQRALGRMTDPPFAFVTITSRPGHVPGITVNHFTKKGLQSPPYITLPLALWRQGWIVSLSLAGLAVYASLRRECAGHEDQEMVLSPYRRSLYGFSADTWSKGVRDLQAHGLLHVDLKAANTREIVRKQRQIYRLDSTIMEYKIPGQPDDKMMIEF